MTDQKPIRFLDGTIPSNRPIHEIYENRHKILKILKGRNHMLEVEESEGPRECSRSEK